mgnify:CR=1 FL=1
MALGCCISFGLAAQQRTSSAVNAGGGSFRNDHYQVDWSIGELARIDTRISDNKRISVQNVQMVLELQGHSRKYRFKNEENCEGTIKSFLFRRMKNYVLSFFGQPDLGS